MIVNVTYRLSQAGQKAALLAGRNASQTVTETMELDDMSLVDELTIEANGTLSLDISGAWIGYYHTNISLDAPPAGVSDVIAAKRNAIAAKQAEEEKRRLEQEARDAAAKAEKERRMAEDAPIVDAYLTELEGRDPLGDWRLPSSPGPYGTFYADSATIRHITPAQTERLEALLTRVVAARNAAAEAKAAEAKAALDAEIAQYGGFRFPVEAGMCGFKGRNLWSSGQTKRWVGVFTNPKGIDTFLDSPRGEYVFVVKTLAPGDCIQGGGYDTNSRGRRRNESEFFGVVISNEPDAIVIRRCASRSDAMKEAANLAKANLAKATKAKKSAKKEGK